MTLDEAARQFFLTYRAAEWFSSVSADASIPAIVVYTRAQPLDPIDKMPHLAGWPLKWVNEVTAPPLLGKEWVDVEPPKKATSILAGAAPFDLAGER